MNSNTYALIIAPGDFREMDAPNLATYRMDAGLMETAFHTGLDMARESIRVLNGEEGNGYVPIESLGFAMAEFESKLCSEDTFIFYYSGHGKDQSILFSNGRLALQSVIDYVNKLPARSKLVILDCCYAGDFSTTGAREMHFEEMMSDFAGKGIAVLASSAADEVSRLEQDGNYSMFTGAVSSAIMFKQKSSGITLDDIYNDVMSIVKVWNTRYPDKAQQPIFRSTLGGTLYFRTGEERPRQQLEMRISFGEYRLVKMKSISNNTEKRLAAFVITPEKPEVGRLALITKQVADIVKYSDPSGSRKTESAKAVWCYYGIDESDIINSLHYAYTIWGADDHIREKYFKQNRNASVVDDIYVFENTSYDMLRKMQEPTKSREDYIANNRRLLALIVSLAERFVYDLQEVFNHTQTKDALQEKYGPWIREVRKRYMELSDEDVPPVDLHDWAEEIYSLAGWVLDLSLYLEKDDEQPVFGDNAEWLLKNGVKRYHDSMEKLKQIEERTKD